MHGKRLVVCFSSICVFAFSVICFGSSCHSCCRKLLVDEIVLSVGRVLVSGYMGHAELWGKTVGCTFCCSNMQVIAHGRVKRAMMHARWMGVSRLHLHPGALTKDIFVLCLEKLQFFNERDAFLLRSGVST